MVSDVVEGPDRAQVVQACSCWGVVPRTMGSQERVSGRAGLGLVYVLKPCVAYRFKGAGVGARKPARS